MVIADGKFVEFIVDKVDLNRNSVLRCLKKYDQGGIESGISVRYRFF